MNITPSKRLTDLLSNYLEFDRNQISLGLWSGDLDIYSVQLKKDAFFPLLNTWKSNHSTNPDLETFFTDEELLKDEPNFASAINLKLLQGSIGHFRARVPWKKLLLGSSDASLQLEITDVTICVGLESCISKALENGDLEKMYSKDTSYFAHSSFISSAESKERLWKQEMIRIAEQHVSEKKDIPTPEEYSKLKVEFLSKFSATERVQVHSILESFVKNFASTLGWRCGQRLKADVQNIRIIFEQDGVEVAISCQSIELDEAPASTIKPEDSSSMFSAPDDSIRKQIVLSDCGIYVRPAPTTGCFIPPHTDDFVIQPTNLSALVTLRNGRRTMTFDQLDQEHRTFETEEVFPKVRRGKREKRNKGGSSETTDLKCLMREDSASNSSSRNSVDMEQIVSLSAKIDQELVKDDLRKISAGISTKIIVEQIVVLLSSRLLDLGNKFLDNAVKVKRGRPDSPFAYSAVSDGEGFDASKRHEIFRKWWRYSFVVTLRCIRRKRRILNAFSYFEVNLNALNSSELKANYIDTYSRVHLKQYPTADDASSESSQRNINKLLSLEDLMQVEQILLFRHLAWMKAEGMVNSSIGSFLINFSVDSSLKKPDSHRARSSLSTKECEPRQHRSSKSLVPPLLMRSNSGKIPKHQRNQSLSVQSISEALDFVPSSSHYRRASDLTSIMEDSMLDEGSIAFKGTFTDAMKQYDGLVSSYSRKESFSSSLDTMISVTSSVSFTVTGITVYVCSECLDSDEMNGGADDDDDVSILSNNTFGFESQDPAESFGAKYMHLFGTRHRIISYFGFQHLRYSSHTEQDGAVQYRRYTVDSFSVWLFGNEFIAVGRNENFQYGVIPLNTKQLSQISFPEHQAHLAPFITGKMNRSKDDNMHKSSLHMKIAPIRMNVRLDDIRSLLDHIFKVETVNCPTPVPLSEFDLVRLNVVSLRRSRQYQPVFSGINMYIECDGVRISICSFERNGLFGSPVEMIVCSKALTYTQLLDDNSDTGVSSSFKDSFVEFPAGKFRNKVISVADFDIKVNDFSLIQSVVRIDMLHSVLSDVTETDRARKSTVILITPMTFQLLSSSTNNLQIILSDVHACLDRAVNHLDSINTVHEIPRLREFVKFKIFRVQVIVQGFKVVCENEDKISNIDTLEARITVIQCAIKDLLSLAICFVPPFDHKSIVFGKLICANRLFASGLPRSVCVECVDVAISKLRFSLENPISEAHKTKGSLYVRGSGQSLNFTNDNFNPSEMIDTVVKSVIDNVLRNEFKTSQRYVSWNTSIIVDTSSGFRLDWEKYTFDSIMSCAIPSISICDGFGSTFLEIQMPDQECHSNNIFDVEELTSSKCSMLGDAGVILSMSSCDCRWDILDGGLPSSILVDDFSVQKESFEKDPLYEISLSLTSLQLHFADKQLRNALEAWNTLWHSNKIPDASMESSTSEKIISTTFVIEVKRASFLFATDLLQPFCNLEFCELTIDIARTKDLQLQNRCILFTAKSRDFIFDDLSPEGQIYPNFLRPIDPECASNILCPFQMTVALSTDPTIYQNEAILLFENMRCILLRRFVNELLQYFMYTNYGVGHFFSVPASSLNQSGLCPSKPKLPINFQVHFLDSTVICPQSSESDDLISFKANKIIMSNFYSHDSWSIPTVGDSVEVDSKDHLSVLSGHSDDTNIFNVHRLNDYSGSVVYDDISSVDNDLIAFDDFVSVSRITVSVQDLKIFVGTSDQQLNVTDESNDHLFYLNRHFQLSADVSHNEHIFICQKSLPSHLTSMRRRFDEIRIRRWFEITDHPVQLEVLTDFVKVNNQMRLLVKDRIVFDSDQEDDDCPFEITLKMSHLYALLSMWYGNMQELAMMFPLTMETIYDSIRDPVCPSTWPEFGSEAFVERMFSNTDKITEIAASFKKLKITCLFDPDGFYPNPLNCLYMIDPESDSVVISSDFFTILMDSDSDKLTRCSCASRSFIVEDIRPKNTVHRFALSIKDENPKLPSKQINMTWGLKSDLKTPQLNLDFAFHVTTFLTPDRWFLANIGMKEIESTTKDLAFFWLILEYFSAYFLNPQYGNPYFLSSIKRLDYLEKNGVEREDVDPDDTCRNLDIRLWLPQPRISIPCDPLSDTSDILILKSHTGGLSYRYRTVGYSFSSQEIVTRDTNLLFLIEPGLKTQSKSDESHRLDCSAKSLIGCLSMDVLYEKFISTNHSNLSINIHNNQLVNSSPSYLSGIEPSSSQLFPLAISAPTVCKSFIQPTRQYLSSTCDITMIPEYLKIAFDAMYAFAGPYPDIPSCPDYVSPTFSVTTNMRAVRFFVCEPVLGIHFPIGVVCISDFKATFSNINPKIINCNSLQAALEFELWIDYFKSGPTRSWEPLLEPFHCTILYEKSVVRGQGISINSNCPLHVNFSGAFLETLDFARRSLQESFYKAIGKYGKTKSNDFEDVPEDDNSTLDTQEARKFVEDLDIGVTHEKAATLRYNDRVAFSLINLTGQTLRYHRYMSQKEMGKTIIGYLDNLKACALEFPPTRTVIRNLHIVEVTSDAFGRIDDLPDFTHYLDIQIPGAMWSHKISVDVTGKRLLRLHPRSDVLSDKLGNNWRLANAFSALVDVSYFEGGRQMTISSPFEIINKTRHNLQLVIHPDPDFINKRLTTDTDKRVPVLDDALLDKMHKDAIITLLSPEEIFHIPTLVMESALELDGEKIGSFWLNPKADCRNYNEKGSDVAYGLSSKACHLVQLIEETDAIFSASSRYFENCSSTGHLLSCPVIDISKEDTYWPFCYCIEVRRSPIVPPFLENENDEIEMSSNCGAGNLNVVPDSSYDGREISNQYSQHGPVAYSLAIYPPIVLENLLPEPARFEIMLLSNRHVVWHGDLKPGESVPVHTVGLDSGLLLLINVGYCRTPNGGGALIHPGSKRAQQCPSTRVTEIDGMHAGLVSSIQDSQNSLNISNFSAGEIKNKSDHKGKHNFSKPIYSNDLYKDYIDCDDVANHHTLVDSLGQRLVLNIDNKLGGGGQRNITISCPYWIVNTTEYALRYKQDRSKEFVSGTIHSPDKDGSKPVDCSRRKIQHENALIDTIFPGRPGALSYLSLNDENSETILEMYTELLSKDIALDRLAEMSFMFNYNEHAHAAGQSGSRICLQVTVPYSGGTLNSEWSRGFSLETVGVPQIIGMHCLDGKQLEVSVSVSVATGKLAAYTKILRIVPRYVVVNLLGRPFRLWQDSSLVHPSRVINDSKIFSETNQGMPNWKRGKKDKDQDASLSPYNFLFGMLPTLDYHQKTQMKLGTVAHRQALYITTVETNQLVPFHLPDTRSDRELRIDLGPNWNLSSSFPVDIISEHSLELNRVVDLRLLKHVDNRARSKYKVVIPPPISSDFDIGTWDGELGIWFETIQWNDGRKIVVKGTRRGKFSYNNTDIHIGDELYAIDGRMVAKMDFDDVMSFLKVRLAETLVARKLKTRKSQKQSSKIRPIKPMFLQRLKRNNGRELDDSAENKISDVAVEVGHNFLTLHFVTLEHRMRKVRENALQKKGTKVEDDSEDASQQMISPRKGNLDTMQTTRKNVFDVDVSMKLLNQSIFIFVKERRTISPYRIENRSIDFCLYFRQKNCDNHPWKSLNPGESREYTWEEPMKANKLLIRVGNPYKLANKEKKGFKFRPSRLIVSEDKGGFGPATMVKLDEVGFRGTIHCPDRDDIIDDSISHENNFLFCSIDTDGATRVLIVSGVESLDFDQELKVLDLQSDLLSRQIQDETIRLKSLENLLIDISRKDHSGDLSTVNEDDDCEFELSHRGEDLLHHKILEAVDYEGEGVITRTHQLLVEVLEATGLQGNNSSDFSRVCNPFCSVRLENRSARQNVFSKQPGTQRTYFIESTLSPKWTGMTFIFDVPSEAEKDPQRFGILVNVKDFHVLGKSKSIGMTEIHLRNLKTQEEVLGWYPLMSRTGRASDILNTAASSRVRGSIKLRIQWIYSTPALLDYFIMLSNKKLKDLSHNLKGLLNRIGQIQNEERAKQEASALGPFSSKIPQLSAVHRSADSQWPFSLRNNMRNSKIRQIFGRRSRTSEANELDISKKQSGADLARKSIKFDDGGYVSHLSTKFVPLLSPVKDNKDVSDDSFEIECDFPQRKEYLLRDIALSENLVNGVSSDIESLAHLLLASNVIFHTPKANFHDSHLTHAILLGDKFQSVISNENEPLKSWVVAYEFLNDPEVASLFLDSKKVSKPVPINSSPIIENIFPNLNLPSRAPQLMKQRNWEFQRSLQKARSDFEKASQRSLLAVVNPGGWLKLRPISALHLPQDYVGMFIKIRYGAETCVTPTVDAKVTPVWSDESKWLNHYRSSEIQHESFDFFSRLETDLEVRVEPMLTSGSLQLSIYGTRVNTKDELGVLNIPLANAISCCTETHQTNTSVVDGVYIRWFPLKNSEVFERCDLHAFHSDMESEKISDDLFSKYYTPCIKLAMWWVPDQDLFFESDCAPLNTLAQEDEIVHKPFSMNKYLNASVESISAALIDSYQTKELLSMKCIDLDARCSITKPMTQISFAMGHFQIDHQGDDSLDSVVISPALGLNPTPTIQLLAIKDNSRSNRSVDSFKHVAFAIDEMNVRIEEDMIMDVMELYRRVIRRKNSRKQSLLRGAAGRMAMHTGGRQFVTGSEQGFHDDTPLKTEVYDEVKAQLKIQEETNRIYIEKLMLGALKLNISYIKSSRKARVNLFGEKLKFFPSKARNKDEDGEDADFYASRDMDAFRRWSEFGFEDEVTRAEIKDFFSSLTFISATIFSSITDSPIRINAKQINNVFEPLEVIGSQLRHFYLKEMIYQMYKVVLSLEAFGNPTMVVNSFMKGASDFVILPFKEFIRSPHNPSRLGLGLARGTLSLISNISSGIFGFVSKTTAFGGTLAASLSFDGHYVRWHAQQAADHARHRQSQIRPNGCDLAMSAFAKPVQDIFAGLIFATSGLVVEPIRGAQQQGLAGFTRGIGIGTIGLVSKPIVGIFDALAHITESIHDLSLSANVFERKSNISRKLRLPYVFSLHKILLPYNPTDARGANLLKLFPLKESRIMRSEIEKEVFVISEAIRVDQGIGMYIVVTTKRVVVFDVTLDGTAAPRKRWQILLDRNHDILSRIDNYLHNGVILRITRFDSNYLSSPKRKNQQEEFNTSTHDDVSASSDNRVTVFNPVTHAFTGFGASKAKKKLKTIYTVYGDFHNRARLTRIHNAICCLTNKLENVVYSAWTDTVGSNQGFTAFGPLHFESEDNGKSSSSISNRLDEIPWVHDFSIPRNYNNSSWSFTDEYNHARKAGGPDWMITSRAKATFIPTKIVLPGQLKRDMPEVKSIIQRQADGLISYNEAVMRLAEIAQSYQLNLSPKPNTESAPSHIGGSENTFEYEGQMSNLPLSIDDSHFVERLTNVEQLLHTIIGNPSILSQRNQSQTNQSSRDYNITSTHIENNCNISAISALTGIEEIEAEVKNPIHSFDSASLENERLRLEVQELRRRLAERNEGMVWREEESQTVASSKRRKRKRVFKAPWK